MTSLDLREHFSRFRAAHPGRVHLAAHSHHYWPDVSFAAQQRCWQDAAELADDKWDKVFGEVIPAAQRHIARILNLPSPDAIAFAPNTHDFTRRLLSCLPAERAARILTTDGEFFSFARQIERLEEDGLVQVDRVAWEPFATFRQRLLAAADATDHDLVFFSHVGFASGYAVPEVASLARALHRPGRLVAVDGYHGFLAVPCDFSAAARHAFYMAGGYKYAMAGEGACFLHVPPGACPRPRDTGWFASFGSLAEAPGRRVEYAADGRRFLGATFDPSGLYRLVAVLDWLSERRIDVATIHAHAHALQHAFVTAAHAHALEPFSETRLVVPLREINRGNFLCFQLHDAQMVSARLAAHDIVTDARSDRLRIGFGLYHATEDVAVAAAAIARVLQQM